MSRARKQKGAVLVVSLLLLLVLTLFAISSVNSSSTNLLVVNNLQGKQEARALAQGEIEQVISTSVSFDDPDSAVKTDAPAANGYTVTVETPTCLDSKDAAGYSATWELTPQDKTWEVVARATNAQSGATSTIHQGIEIKSAPNSGC
jgi:Tfp pilus assembly protein PilX